MHTVASPFCEPIPASNITHNNKYGFYNTFRVVLPGSFSGTYNDASVSWRSVMYHSMAHNLAELEVAKKSKGAIKAIDKPVVVSNLVDCGFGDLSGNYLVQRDAVKNHERAALTAASTLKNASANLKQLHSKIANLVTGPAKQHLIEFKRATEQKDLVNGISADRVSLEENLAMENKCNDSLQIFKITANTINLWQIASSLFERDIGVTFRVMADNIKGFSNTPHAHGLIDEYALYLV